MFWAIFAIELISHLAAFSFGLYLGHLNARHKDEWEKKNGKR